MTIVSIWQLDCSDTETALERKNRVFKQLPQILAEADLVVLPELWLSGAFNLPEIVNSATLIDAEFAAHLQQLVDESGSCLHAGTFAVPSEINPAKFTNTAWMFRANQPLATYRKQHLFGFADGEKTIMDASDDVVVSKTCLGKSGLATCYDLRFPEQFRDLVDVGADNFIVSAAWPTARLHHWQVLTQARAIENQAFVIGANSVGLNANVELAGNSLVVSPTGAVLAMASATETVLSVDIDISLSAKWRNEFPALDDRRSV